MSQSSATLDGRLAHLTPDERAALKELVNRLYKRYGDDLLRMVLFGSKARNDFDEESDLDVLIVAKIPEVEYWQQKRRIIYETYDLDLEYDVVLSLLIEDESEYLQMCKWDLLINQNIQQDGIELWTSQQSEKRLA